MRERRDKCGEGWPGQGTCGDGEEGRNPVKLRERTDGEMEDETKMRLREE